MIDSDLLTNFKTQVRINSEEIGKIKVNPDRRLKIAYSKYCNDPNNRASRGNYLGYLFELYVTPLLIKSASDLDSVKWIIPIGQKTKPLSMKKRKNRLSYTTKGELVIFDSNVPAADFDGIIKLGSKIIIIEQKYNISGKNAKTAIKRILTRRNLFSAAYDKDPDILLTVPSNINSFDNRDQYEAHPKISILEIDHFHQFQQMFENNTFPSSQLTIKKVSSKIREPHLVFSKILDFSSPRNQLRNAFLSYLNNKCSSNEFFLQNKKHAYLVNKFVFGKIDSNIKFKNLFDDPYNVWKKYQKKRIPLILFVKFREPRVYPEVIAYKYEGKTRIKRMRRSHYSFHDQIFSLGKLNARENTLSSFLTKKASTNPKTQIIKLKQLRKIIESCQELTKYWIENSPFWIPYEEKLLSFLQ